MLEIKEEQQGPSGEEYHVSLPVPSQRQGSMALGVLGIDTATVRHKPSNKVIGFSEACRNERRQATQVLLRKPEGRWTVLQTYQHDVKGS